MDGRGHVSCPTNPTPIPNQYQYYYNFDYNLIPCLP